MQYIYAYIVALLLPTEILIRLSELNEELVMYLFPVNYTKKYACVTLKMPRSVPSCTLCTVNFVVYLHVLREMW